MNDLARLDFLQSFRHLRCQGKEVFKPVALRVQDDHTHLKVFDLLLKHEVPVGGHEDVEFPKHQGK